jgi:tetratricopeptide (TPR) repeat protein
MTYRLAFILSFACVGAGHAAPANATDQLGTIRFEVSGNDAARDHVLRGVKLLHHMTYVEAEREFSAAIKADPECVLAYWGRAMTLVHPVWNDEPTAAELKRGWDDVQAGLARKPKTAREKAYLATTEEYFRDAATREHRARLEAIDMAWMRTAAEFPDDLDAAAFSALFSLGPVRYLPKDKSHRIQLAAGALAQKVLAKIPDHPGAQHYKIHAYDFPLLADRALEVCDNYGNLAPGVPHALHMPTHIYTRRGLWAKSIEFNRRSADAARKAGESTGGTNINYAHALDYLVYAYLQRGQYREADAIRQRLAALPGPFAKLNSSGMAFAFAAIPARYALERHAWAEAAALELRQPASFPWSDAFPQCDSMGYFARALGAARTGKLDVARSAIAELEKLHGRLEAAQRTSYWTSQAETQLLSARGWVALKEGNANEAIALLRRAAELEAAVDKEAVTPGEVLPAGELLGDLLAEVGQHREALAAYEAMLELTPNRFNSVHGAAVSAERSGDAAKAAKYYAAVVELAVDADAGVERVEQARRFLAAKPTARAE